ncbi:beta-glucosidase [Klebsiella pneumoniae]|uniref:Beta-glucosidase n=1 Tax=Klebsiella pneumoniae TaxID=573 RepID=A0A377VYY1_KLEPN|nr:beta-glucosidase [Klebsiella pneumoniae]
MVLNLTPSYTLTDSDADKKPPGMPTCFLTAASLDPLVKHEFPKALCEILAAHDCLPTTSKDDAALILSADIDFLG